MADALHDYWQRATGGEGVGFDPYPYQRQIAENGLPELVEVPTGCGKTMVALAWLWRSQFHPDPAVRTATPRRLVFVLPQRTLVEQVAENVRGWLANLGIEDQVGCHVLMGGEGRRSGAWRVLPEKPAVLVATQDMALSAALNRRYGESRWMWPIDFGLLNNDCAWVFDEVQLMGPGLGTSRQLEGLRRALGVAADCSSTWMSATVDHDELATIDLPGVSTFVALSDQDRTGSLGVRLQASRRIEKVEVGERKTYIKDLAAAVVGAHSTGTRTLVVCNTVRRATDLFQEVTKRRDQVGDAPVVLVHSRFRPGDRARHLATATAEVDPDGPGLIVVSTQVLEAGVDITSETLLTEASLWSSLVQRAGRCNRLGLRNATARLLWCEPPDSAPYEESDVKAAIGALDDLEGRSMTTAAMAELAPASGPGPVHALLRRRDLLELFDTLPDLSGADLDVSRFIRDADERDVAVAWQDLGGQPPVEGHPLPVRAERCSVPLADSKAIGDRAAWRHDHILGRWVACRTRDLRPGMVVIIDSDQGGYDPELGWAPTSKRSVDPVDVHGEISVLETDNDLEGDPVSMTRKRWLSLGRHLRDVEDETATMLATLSPLGLGPGQATAAVRAAALHDWGKAHEVFQATLEGTIATDVERAEADAAGSPWAKSAGSHRSRHSRRYFRHELASALALLTEGRSLLDGEQEPDLVVYLVAAHHGRVRLGFRSMPGEVAPNGDDTAVMALGVVHGEELPPLDLGETSLPRARMDLSVMKLGSGPGGEPSWSQRMLPLRDRLDLGPFRLGYLEAVVRLADWRASAAADQVVGEELP